MINKGRITKLIQKLIQIPSENPPGDESRIARFVEKELKKSGLKTKLYEFKKNRTNVVGILDFGAKKSVLLSPHLDTVPAGRNWKYPPFSGKIVSGKVFGRGATDCKGNLAAALEALQSITEDKIKLNCNVIFAATADEETGSSLGLIPLLKRKILKPDLALILDADGFNIIVAQKGLIHFKVKIFGKKSHGAYPERGINAIELSSKIINDLKEYKFKFKKHPLLKGPTVNIGIISGGDKVNIVADWCEFEVDLRYLPGTGADSALRQVRSVISRYAKNFKIEIDDIQRPYTIDKYHFFVKALIRATKAVKGHAYLKGSEGATVITFFQDTNIPAIASGFGRSGTAHITDEYAKVDDLYKGAMVLEEFFKRINF